MNTIVAISVIILSLIIFLIAWRRNPNLRSQQNIRNPRSFINVIGYVILIAIFSGVAFNAIIEFQDDVILKYIILTLLVLMFAGSFFHYFYLVRKKNWSANKIWGVAMIMGMLRLISIVFSKKR